MNDRGRNTSRDERRAQLSARRRKLSEAQRVLLEERLAALSEKPSVDNRQNEVVSCLVQMQSGKSGLPPLFLAHNLTGEVISYVNLVGKLREDHPCYGMQASGLLRDLPSRCSLEEMAEQYLQAVERVSAGRSVALGGWSFGGVLAFEMARQLLERGGRVGLFFGIDTYAPVGVDEEQLTEHQTLLQFAETLGIPSKEVEQAIPRVESNLKGALTLLRTQLKNRSPSQSAYSRNDIERLFHVFQTNLKALLQYAPQPYGGTMLLFKGRGSLADRADLGWAEVVAGGVEVITMQADHYSIIEEPTVSTIASELSMRLRQMHMMDQRD